MWIVQMNNNGPAATIGLAELSHGLQEENKEIRDGVMGEGQGLSQEEESQINEDDGGINDGCGEVAQAVSQRSKQQSQGPLVCWGSFLPLRSLKVLLVENDDSTRHVVCALLRNSGYEVMAASDALRAWKLLEDLTNHFDLVLTEVVMPCLTGFGLLCKIKRHKTLRNIPVITMSSHCSMSVVFKCLSKGAVDFLVKPVRKNELKNLWQHVWRKCHSASGSGSENAVRTQKSTESKSADQSNNKTSSNGEDDNGSIGLNLRDGSDHGSGTQSSWTKRVVEVDSPKSTSPWNQLADHPDSTSAPVIHSTEQACVNNWFPGIVTKECKQQEHELDNHVMGKDLEIGVPRIPNLQLEDPSEKEFTKMAGNNREKFPEMNLDKDDDRIEGQLDLNSEKSIGELRNQASDLRGVIANSTAHAENTVLGTANGASNVSNTKVGVIYETKETPSLELSLKRVRDIGEMETSVHDRNVLRHSDLSAFSRYNSSATANQGPTGNAGSCSPFDNSSEAVKAVSMQNVQSNSNSTPPNQGSNGSSNNDMGSTTKNAFTKVVAFRDKPAPKSAVKIRNPISAFQSVQNGHAPPQHTAQGKSDTEVTKTVSAQARTNKQVQVQHRHYHHHHHHHHVHKLPHEKVSDNDLPLKNMVAEAEAEAEAEAAPQCGSSNKLSTLFAGNAGNHYLNGSASGSNHGSNGANGCNTVLTPRGTNMESDNGAAGKCETGSVIGFGSTPGVVQNGHTLREAALNKFRHKRKERCFKKKVRYQSRKTLAEQRPRVRGQFVRQAAQDNKGNDALR